MLVEMAGFPYHQSIGACREVVMLIGMDVERHYQGRLGIDRWQSLF